MPPRPQPETDLAPDRGAAVPPPPPAVPAAEAAAARADAADGRDTMSPHSPSGAQGVDSRVAERIDDIPPKPPLPAASRPPRKKRAPRKKAPAVPAVPDKPEIPAAVAAASYQGAAQEPVATPEPLVAPEPESLVEPAPEPAPAQVLEPESVIEPEPEIVPEPEPEPVIESGPEAVVEPEPEPVVVPEPEPEPVVVPEPEPEPVIEPEPEPVMDADAETFKEPERSDVEASDLELLLGDGDADDAEAVAEGGEPAAVPAPWHPPHDIAGNAGEAPALRLRGVTKSFGQTRAVDAVDLEIPAGSFYGLVGPNGAGKTTTLSMIAGLLRPDSGTVEIAGVDLGRDPRGAKAQMGVLPDRLRTFDRLSGRQLLHYYGVLRGLRPAVVAERAADLARAFDLTSALGRPVSDYSAGMTKKLLLAGAMIHAPRLLVLDEPFEAVDPVSSGVILEILSTYVASGGTVILSSHGMDLVERVCDGVAVIVAGQVLARGTVDEVRGDHTLAERFVQLAGGRSDVEGLEWLHTYSD